MSALIGEEKRTSLKQMRNRMHAGHRQILVAAAQGRQVRSGSDGEALGYRTARQTLHSWGALGAGGITETGIALLLPAGATEDEPRGVEEFTGTFDAGPYV